MANKRKRWLIIAIAAQLLVLLVISGSYYVVEAVGTTVRLQTVPVDPRDILYGDYVALKYEISSLPMSKWVGETTKPDTGDRLYVSLKKRSTDMTLYELDAVSADKGSLDDAAVILRAKVDYVNEAARTLEVSYGIERYYVAEGEGQALEQSDGQFIVEVKVAPWSQLHITDLEIRE